AAGAAAAGGEGRRPGSGAAGRGGRAPAQAGPGRCPSHPGAAAAGAAGPAAGRGGRRAGRGHARRPGGAAGTPPRRGLARRRARAVAGAVRRSGRRSRAAGGARSAGRAHRGRTRRACPARRTGAARRRPPAAVRARPRRQPRPRAVAAARRAAAAARRAGGRRRGPPAAGGGARPAGCTGGAGGTGRARAGPRPRRGGRRPGQRPAGRLRGAGRPGAGARGPDARAAAARPGPRHTARAGVPAGLRAAGRAGLDRAAGGAAGGRPGRIPGAAGLARPGRRRDRRAGPAGPVAGAAGDPFRPVHRHQPAPARPPGAPGLRRAGLPQAGRLSAASPCRRRAGPRMQAPPRPVTAMTAWSIDHARKTYSIPHWSEGYYDAGDDGRMVVRPLGEAGVAIPLPEIVDKALARGAKLPLLVRFPDILGDRLRRLQAAFAQAQADWDYPGGYTAVYPIKVNQHAAVAGTLASHHGGSFGLEAGSKPDVMAVLARARPGGLMVSDGYTDREYIRLALIGRKLGLDVFLVVEKPSELPLILEEAAALGVEPRIGVRMRLASLGAGKWQNSGGDKAKFGLSPRQVLDLWKTLRDGGNAHWLGLLHFHMGSQISNVRDIANGMREATRYFVELSRLGATI